MLWLTVKCIGTGHPGDKDRTLLNFYLIRHLRETQLGNIKLGNAHLCLRGSSFITTSLISNTRPIRRQMWEASSPYPGASHGLLLTDGASCRGPATGAHGVAPPKNKDFATIPPPSSSASTSLAKVHCRTKAPPFAANVQQRRPCLQMTHRAQKFAALFV